MASASTTSAKRRADEAESPLRRLLVSTKLADVSHGRRHVVTIMHNASAEDALHDLAEHHILSAPVVLAPSLEDEDSDTYMGIIDIAEILKALVEDVLEDKADVADRWGKLKSSALPFFERKVITLMGKDVQLRYRGEVSQTLHELIVDGFLGAGESESAHDLTHRIAIFSQTGRVTDVISMSDIVRFLHKHKSSIGDNLRQKTAEDLGWLKQDVLTASQSDTVASVLHIMAKKNRAAVAVIDEKNQFCQNFSTSDLRGLTTKQVPLLLHSVNDFLHKMKKTHQHEADVTCTAKSTFESILDKLTKQKVHRLYIIDDENHVVGVVSLTDILRAVIDAE
eukprot:gene1501-4659_t